MSSFAFKNKKKIIWSRSTFQLSVSSPGFTLNKPTLVVLKTIPNNVVVYSNTKQKVSDAVQQVQNNYIFKLCTISICAESHKTHK